MKSTLILALTFLMCLPAFAEQSERRGRGVNRHRSDRPRRDYVRRTHRSQPRIRVDHHRRYRDNHSYSRSLPSRHRRGNWISRNYRRHNGYFYYNDYPYFVYNNNLHRYSSYDSCKYELVDTYNDYAVESFYGTCARSYDRCAIMRNDYNDYDGSDQYFCAEKY